MSGNDIIYTKTVWFRTITMFDILTLRSFETARSVG